jgi:hypothetical protein
MALEKVAWNDALKAGNDACSSAGPAGCLGTGDEHAARAAVATVVVKVSFFAWFIVLPDA